MLQQCEHVNNIKLFMLLQIAEAMKHLHDMNFVDGNVKSENVFKSLLLQIINSFRNKDIIITIRYY